MSPESSSHISKDKYPYANTKTYAFLKEAIAEGAHIPVPENFSVDDKKRDKEDLWVRMRNVAGTYYSCDISHQELADLYGIAHQGAGRLVNRFVRHTWENSSDRIKKEYPLTDVLKPKPATGKSRLRPNTLAGHLTQEFTSGENTDQETRQKLLDQVTESIYLSRRKLFRTIKQVCRDAGWPKNPRGKRMTDTMTLLRISGVPVTKLTHEGASMTFILASDADKATAVLREVVAPGSSNSKPEITRPIQELDAFVEELKKADPAMRAKEIMNILQDPTRLGKKVSIVTIGRSIRRLKAEGKLSMSPRQTLDSLVEEVVKTQPTVRIKEIVKILEDPNKLGRKVSILTVSRSIKRLASDGKIERPYLKKEDYKTLEAQVEKGLANGQSNQEIADELGQPVRRVENITYKLRKAGKIEPAAKGAKRQLIEEFLAENNQKKTNLSDVARRFGVSREYVRQVRNEQEGN